MIETIGIEAIEAQVKAAQRIYPGLPIRISEAAGIGEGVWQGDLGLEIISSVPEGYKKVTPSAQLVPGNTQGARHTLDSLSGVEMYYPVDWPNGLKGPIFHLTEERTILHPTHGAVTIPSGYTIICRYQREWDTIQRAERRNAD